MNDQEMGLLGKHAKRLLTPAELTTLADHRIPLTGPAGLRRYLAERDFETFLAVYFGDELTVPWSETHLGVLAQVQDLRNRWVSKRKGRKLALAIPRGLGKTSLLSRLQPLWRFLSGTSPLTLLIGNNAEAATRLVRNVRVCYEQNTRLQEDYPGVQGEVWTSEKLVNRNGSMIAGLSRGSGAIRGVSTGNSRVTLAVLDDIDDDQSVASAIETAQATDWLIKSVLPTGDNLRGTSSFVIVGTRLSKQSVLEYALTSPDFESTIRKGILAFPTNGARIADWERWLLKQAADQQAPSDYDSDTFWQTHKADLEQGSEVIWPQLGGALLYQYLRYRLAHGERAFRAEVQNELDDGSTLALGVYPTVEASQVPSRADCELLLSVDPSEGRSAKSDYAAVVEVLWHSSTRSLYVVWADLERRSYTEVISSTAERVKTRGTLYDGAWCEVNGLGGIFADLLQKRLNDDGCDLVAVRYYSRIPKNDRIALLGELARQGRLFFVTDLPDEMRREWESFPTGRNDDGLDAVATVALKLREQGRLDPLV